MMDVFTMINCGLSLDHQGRGLAARIGELDKLSHVLQRYSAFLTLQIHRDSGEPEPRKDSEMESRGHLCIKEHEACLGGARGALILSAHFASSECKPSLRHKESRLGACVIRD